MKKTRSIIGIYFLVSFTLSSYSQDINKIDKDGSKQGFWLIYQIDTVQRFRAYVKKISDSNNERNENENRKLYYEINHFLKAKGNYLNNKKDGHWTYYYPEILIDQSKTTTHITIYKGDSAIFENFYKKEKIKSEINYVNDTFIGNYKMYYENGTLKSEIYFTNDKPVGEVNIYYSNGKLMYTGTHLFDKEFCEGTSYNDMGGKMYEKKLSIKYILDNFSDIKEIKN